MFLTLRYPFIQTVSATAMTLLFASNFAQAGGEGGGFNGPTLSPISIPVHSDRGVTDVDAMNAMRVCLIEGDPSRGVRSVLQKLAEAIFPGNPNLALPRGGEIQILHDNRYLVANKMYYGIYDANDLKHSKVLLFGSPQWGDSSGNRWNLDLVFKRDGSLLQESPYGRRQLLGDTEINTVSDLPRLEYDSEVDDSDYDQWGNVIQKRTLLKGFRIETPQESKDKIGFVNTYTGHPIALTINTQDYIRCLQSQIQLEASN